MANVLQSLTVEAVTVNENNGRPRGHRLLPSVAAGIDFVRRATAGVPLDQFLMRPNCVLKFGVHGPYDAEIGDEEWYFDGLPLPEWAFNVANIDEAAALLTDPATHLNYLDAAGLLDRAGEVVTYSITWQFPDAEMVSVEFVLRPHFIARQLVGPTGASDLRWRDVNESWELALVDRPLTEADAKCAPLEDPITHEPPVVGDVLYHRRGTSVCLKGSTVRDLQPLPDGTEPTRCSFVDLAQ